MSANQCIIKTEEIFADKFMGIEKDKYVLYSVSEYYEMIAKCIDKIEMWMTDYCHEIEYLYQENRKILFPFKKLFLVGRK